MAINIDDPYSVPQSNLIQGTPKDKYGKISIFSIQGRIGQLRYLLYMLMSIFCVGLVFIVAIPAQSLLQIIFFKLAITDAFTQDIIRSILFYAPLLLIFSSVIFNTIKRLHDINLTGWFLIFMFVPSINIAVGLLLIFIPGTPTHNNFGLLPPPNTIMVQASTVLLIIAFVSVFLIT